MSNEGRKPATLSAPMEDARNFPRSSHGQGETPLRVRSADGACLTVWRSGGGPPLVLVHGTTVTHSDWAPVLPALRRQFTVYAMDRRGIGASGDGPSYALEREFEDVAAVVDGVGQPVYLLGHSFGALCALEAARLTAGIRKLVLYEPPIPMGPDFHPPRLLERLDAFLAAGNHDEVLATFLREVAGQDARRVALQQRTGGWPARAALAPAVVREVHGTHYYVLRPERFAAVTVPALLLLGGASPAKHVLAANALAAALPNSRVSVLAGQGHIAMHTATELFVAEIARFLNAPAA